MREAILYKQLGENTVECAACAWRCKIYENRTGVCGVRQNISGKLFLLVYGRVVSANVDPMEKKPMYHFLPGEKIFSIGTVGCNFGCDFCQNFDISQASRTGARAADIEKSGDELSPKEIVDFCLDHRLPAIAFTYNEPAIFTELAAEVMELAKPRGIKGVFVSNGYETTEALNFLEPYIDAYNIDLKGFTEKFYQKVCKAKLFPVLETIEEIFKRGKWLEITTLLVPGENDSEKELKQVAQFIASVSADIPWHLSAFYPTYIYADRVATPPETLVRAYEIGKKAGLKYVYVGNVADKKRSTTYCPSCGEALIIRSGFAVSEYNIKNGQCGKCKIKIAGIWQ